MKTTKKILLPAAIIILGFASMLFFMSMKEEQPRKAPTPRTKFVKVEVVKLQPIAAEIPTFGRISSAQPVQLVSEVAGEIMDGDIVFRPAQKFSRNDILVKIDDRQARMNLMSKKSEFLTALANVLPEIKLEFPAEYPTWQAYFEANGFEKDIPVMPEADNQKIKLYLSRFNVYRLYYEVRDLEIMLEKHYFRAPFDGAVATVNYQTGATARAGTTLGEIINLEEMELEMQVPVQDLQWIDYNRPVGFQSRELGNGWTGRIKRTGSSLDDRTQTVPVYVGLDKQGRADIISGLFTDVTIPGKVIENAYTIPHQAMYGANSVYLIENGRLVQRTVSVIRRESNYVIVNDGLLNGDTLVVEVMQGISNGMPARPSNLALESN